MKRMLMVLTAAVAAVTVQAKTVALWPLGWNIDGNKADVRCAIDPANDLTVASATTKADIQPGWDLPSNPDTSSMLLFTPKAGTGSIANGTAQGYLTSGTAGIYLSPSRSFTLEGWMKLNSVAGVGGSAWSVLGGTDIGVAGGQGFMLSLRKSGDRCYPQMTVYFGTYVDTDFSEANYREAALKDWNHWALTYEPNDGNGHCVFTFYLNGVSAGSVTSTAITSTLDNAGHLFLGARPTGNTINGSLRYVRISDEVLVPTRFLNASGSTVKPSATVAYWKMGCDEQGGVDVRPSVGTAPLQYGFYNSAYDLCGFSTDPEGAFSGQPANGTVTLAGGNSGSFRGEGKNGVMRVAGLGSSVAHNADFTIEGWLKPEVRNGSQIGVRYVFGKQSNGHGWNLTLTSEAGTRGVWFEIGAVDASGIALSRRQLGEAIPDWNGWKHVALVHTATGGSGHGSWQLYLDGLLHGTVDNPRDVAEDAAVTVFNLGGLPGNDCFCGRIDCVRVCGAALSSDQFLNAKNGTAATSVLAFWPMDYAVDGAYPVLTDVVGSYTIGAVPPTANRAVPMADAPTISNPDRTQTMRDAPSASTGSVGFRSFSGTGARALMYSVDPGAISAFKDGTTGFTVETYLKPAAANGWQILYFTSASPTIHNGNGYPATRFWFRRQADNTLMLTDWSFLGKQDISFGSAKLTEGKWQHVAVTLQVKTVNNVKKAIWKLYIEGVDSGTIEDVAVNETDTTANYNYFAIGGRAGSDQSFTGQMAHIRVSKGVLDQSEFLCAAAQPIPETEVVTRSYWPIDYENASLNLIDRIFPSNAFEPQGVVGSDERARGSVPRPDATISDGKRNIGSAFANAGGLMMSARAGEAVSMSSAFTVEGWLKWTKPSVGADEFVCGTDLSGYGWRLSIDSTGAKPLFRIRAYGQAGLTACIDTAFDYDVSALSGVWNHLALSYDPKNGNGVWVLTVEGEKVGEVENEWRDASDQVYLSRFALGGSGAQPMGFDMWRLSRGVRTADALLWGKRMGLFMVVK